MKLQKHHIEWLERNDGNYTCVANRGRRINEEGVHEENKCIFIFNSTQISFNPKGLAQTIDKVLELYPERRGK